MGRRLLVQFSFFPTLVFLISFAADPLQPLEFLYSFGKFFSAQSISIAPNGLVYIADTGDNKVILFSGVGDSIRDVGGYGWGQLEFDRPYDVFAGIGLNVFVADYGNHRVQRFDRDLNYISTLFTRDNDNPAQRLGYPTGVTLSRLGDLFVLDAENIRAVKMNTFGTFERTFGGIDAGKGRLRNPRQVSVTKKDLVAVLDEQTIVLFDNFGNYLRTIGQGVLRSPRGLTVANDTLYVTDGPVVYLFSLEGKLHTKLYPGGGKETEPEERFIDVAVYRNHVLLLTEREVQVFEWRKNVLDNH